MGDFKHFFFLKASPFLMERLQFDSKPEHLQDGYGFEVTTIYFFLLIPVGGSKQQQKWLIRSQVGCESRTSIPT